MAAGRQPARERRADRDAVGDEIENRRRRRDVAVQPPALHPTIAPGRPPLLAPLARGSAAIEPANPGDPHRSWIAAEEERDVRNARRRRKDRRRGGETPGFDDGACHIRKIAAVEQLPQHVDARAVDEHEDGPHRTESPAGCGACGARSQHSPSGLHNATAVIIAAPVGVTNSPSTSPA